MSTRFLCRVSEEGHLVPLQPERLLRWRGKELWISAHEQPSPGLRSSEANRFYWAGCIRAICEETGNDPETVHLALKREAVRLGVLDPEYICIGDQTLEAEPTTVTDAETFSRYVTWVVDWARTKLNVHVEEQTT